MKINSDSLKEDVTKLLVEGVSYNPDTSAEVAERIRAFFVMMVEFATSNIDHSKVETPEDLEACTCDVARRVSGAMCLLTGQAATLSMKGEQNHGFE